MFLRTQYPAPESKKKVHVFNQEPRSTETEVGIGSLDVPEQTWGRHDCSLETAFEQRKNNLNGCEDV